MPNVMAAMPNIGGALWPSVQRRKVWLKPATRVPCNAKTRNPVEICRGARNWSTDLSR